MTAAAAPTPDLTLDACAALRADVAAQHAPRPAPAGAAPGVADRLARATPANASPAEEPSTASDTAAREAAWLLLVTSIERGAQLDARRRPAHFRRARAVWEDAAGALGEPKYAEAGTRLARWRAGDPTLPLVKLLLWALEQPEAAGYTHLALAGYTALARLTPRDDVRRGYIVAQSARALRTLGDLQGAVGRYEFGERVGTTQRDRWLRVRSAIGLSAAYTQLGNYPAARRVFDRVLGQGSPDPRFTAAAHHGLIMAATAARDWETALRHGWHLLRAARAGVAPRTDALLLMAGLCRRIGRYRAAASAGRAALRVSVRPDDLLVAHRILADVGLAAGDRDLATSHGGELRKLLHTGAGAFEDTRSLHTLARVEERWGSEARARADVEQAYAAARAHRFHELEFEIEPTWTRLREVPDRTAPSPAGVGTTGEHAVELSAQARRIVSRIAEVEGTEPWLATAAV